MILIRIKSFAPIILLDKAYRRYEIIHSESGMYHVYIYIIHETKLYLKCHLWQLISNNNYILKQVKKRKKDYFMCGQPRRDDISLMVSIGCRQDTNYNNWLRNILKYIKSNSVCVVNALCYFVKIHFTHYHSRDIFSRICWRFFFNIFFFYIKKIPLI